MDKQSSTSGQISRFNIDDWKQVSYESGGRILQNKQNSAIQLQQYTLILSSPKQVEPTTQLLTHSTSSPYLVKTHHYQLFTQARPGHHQSPHSGTQASICTGLLYRQRIRHRIKDLQLSNLSARDFLHIASQVAGGFEALYRTFGAFGVQGAFLGINEARVVKIWFNSDFGAVVPYQSLGSEEEMAKDILDLFQAIRDQSNVLRHEINFKEYVMKDYQRINFDTLKRKINQYSIQYNHGVIPERLQSVIIKTSPRKKDINASESSRKQFRYQISQNSKTSYNVPPNPFNNFTNYAGPNSTANFMNNSLTHQSSLPLISSSNYPSYQNLPAGPAIHQHRPASNILPHPQSFPSYNPYPYPQTHIHPHMQQQNTIKNSVNLNPAVNQSLQYILPNQVQGYGYPTQRPVSNLSANRLNVTGNVIGSAYSRNRYQIPYQHTNHIPNQYIANVKTNSPQKYRYGVFNPPQAPLVPQTQAIQPYRTPQPILSHQPSHPMMLSSSLQANQFTKSTQTLPHLSIPKPQHPSQAAHASKFPSPMGHYQQSVKPRSHSSSVRQLVDKPMMQGGLDYLRQYQSTRPLSYSEDRRNLSNMQLSLAGTRNQGARQQTNTQFPPPPPNPTNQPPQQPKPTQSIIDPQFKPSQKQKFSSILQSLKQKYKIGSTHNYKANDRSVSGSLYNHEDGGGLKSSSGENTAYSYGNNRSIQNVNTSISNNNIYNNAYSPQKQAQKQKQKPIQKQKQTQKKNENNSTSVIMSQIQSDYDNSDYNRSKTYEVGRDYQGSAHKDRINESKVDSYKHTIQQVTSQNNIKQYTPFTQLQLQSYPQHQPQPQPQPTISTSKQPSKYQADSQQQKDSINPNYFDTKQSNVAYKKNYSDVSIPSSYSTIGVSGYGGRRDSNYNNYNTYNNDKIFSNYKETESVNTSFRNFGNNISVDQFSQVVDTSAHYEHKSKDKYHYQSDNQIMDNKHLTNSKVFQYNEYKQDRQSQRQSLRDNIQKSPMFQFRRAETILTQQNSQNQSKKLKIQKQKIDGKPKSGSKQFNKDVAKLGFYMKSQQSSNSQTPKSRIIQSKQTNQNPTPLNLWTSSSYLLHSPIQVRSNSKRESERLYEELIQSYNYNNYRKDKQKDGKISYNTEEKYYGDGAGGSGLYNYSFGSSESGRKNKGQVEQKQEKRDDYLSYFSHYSNYTGSIPQTKPQSNYQYQYQPEYQYQYQSQNQPETTKKFHFQLHKVEQLPQKQSFNYSNQNQNQYQYQFDPQILADLQSRVYEKNVYD